MEVIFLVPTEHETVSHGLGGGEIRRETAEVFTKGFR